jgi:hypothetical protein
MVTLPNRGSLSVIRLARARTHAVAAMDPSTCCKSV